MTSLFDEVSFQRGPTQTPRSQTYQRAEGGIIDCVALLFAPTIKCRFGELSPQRSMRYEFSRDPAALSRLSVPLRPTNYLFSLYFPTP